MPDGFLAHLKILVKTLGEIYLWGMWLDGERAPTGLDNRAFWAGENPQTTMLCLDGKVVFLPEHFARLRSAFHYFDPGGPWEELRRGLSAGLRRLIPERGRHRARVSIFRDHQLAWHWAAHVDAQEDVSGRVLRVCWAGGLRGVSSLPPEIKLGAYGISDWEVARAKEKGFDDVLFLNHRRQVLESSRSNVFFRLGDRFVTPLKQSGMLAGITRQKIIDLLGEEGRAPEERMIHAREVEGADEMWLTAAISGVRRVGRFGPRDFPPGDGVWERIVERFGELCRERAVVPGEKG